MGIEALIKPLLAMQGFHKLRIRLDGSRRIIFITGKQNGQPVNLEQSFEELEALINGPGPTTEEREAGGVLPNIGPGGDRPT